MNIQIEMNIKWRLLPFGNQLLSQNKFLVGLTYLMGQCQSFQLLQSRDENSHLSQCQVAIRIDYQFLKILPDVGNFNPVQFWRFCRNVWAVQFQVSESLLLFKQIRINSQVSMTPKFLEIWQETDCLNVTIFLFLFFWFLWQFKSWNIKFFQLMAML